MPDPWPKQCPYMDRCERSVIATLVNTKVTFNNIGGATTGSIDGYVFTTHIPITTDGFISQIAQRRWTGREYGRVERRRFQLATRRWTYHDISLHAGLHLSTVSFVTFTLPAYGLSAVSIPQEHCQYQHFHLYYLVKCEYNNGRDVSNLT